MKILYISTVCSPKVLDFIFDSSVIKPGQAVQKFHRLLIEGFSMNRDFCNIEVLTSLPVSPNTHKKVFWNISADDWEGVNFKYVPFVNFPILKHLFVFSYTFFKVLFWRIVNKRTKNVVFCDILNTSIVWATFLACKLTEHPIAVIVTDLPVFMVSGNDKQTFIKKMYLKITSFVLNRFDYYIGLTEQMNKVINPFERPFLVMEGLVDENMKKETGCSFMKNDKRTLIYAGGIYEKYGVNNLLEAFMSLKLDDVELHIYGSGDMETKMKEYCALDKRILYFGVVKNSLVVENLEKATLLINPRPTVDEFTKFSFPSKNMEYMVSGTPLLTTKLPGMPEEYNDYVYLFEEETIDGMVKTLESLMSKSDEEFKCFGNKAKKFVLENKSSSMQARKIINFIKQ